MEMTAAEMYAEMFWIAVFIGGFFMLAALAVLVMGFIVYAATGFHVFKWLIETAERD